MDDESLATEIMDTDSQPEPEDEEGAHALSQDDDDDLIETRRIIGATFVGGNYISLYAEMDAITGTGHEDDSGGNDHNHNRNRNHNHNHNHHNHNGNEGDEQKNNMEEQPSIGTMYDQWTEACNASLEELSRAVVGLCQSVNIDGQVTETTDEHHMFMAQIWTEVQAIYGSLEPSLLNEVLRSTGNLKEWIKDRCVSYYMVACQQEPGQVCQSIFFINMCIF